jgi:hypothetical protein
MVEAAARNIQAVRGHEFDDLKGALGAGDPGGQRDLHGLRFGERRAVFEEVVGKNRKNRGVLDRHGAAWRRHRAPHTVRCQSSLAQE